MRRGSANARLGHAYPWYATYSSHIPASLRTFPQRKPLRRPAEAAAAEAEAAAEAAAAEAFLESPELMEADAHAAGGKDAVDGGGMEPPELVFELDEPTFAPTYRTWTVEYTDGTSKVFEAYRPFAGAASAPRRRTAAPVGRRRLRGNAYATF